MFAPDVGAAEVSALEGVGFGDSVDRALGGSGHGSGIGGAAGSGADNEETEGSRGGSGRERDWRKGWFFHGKVIEGCREEGRRRAHIQSFSTQ